MKFLSLAVLGVQAARLSGPAANDFNPPPVHEINVSLEAATPNAVGVRGNYEDARTEAANLANLAERSFRDSAQLEALLGSSFLQRGDVPVVDVGLASGSEHAQVASTIGSLQKEARTNFAQGVARLNQSFEKALFDGKTAMADSVRRHFGAVSFAVDEPSFRVDVVPTASDEGAGSAAAQQVFGRKGAAAAALIQSASAELKEIANVLSAEFDKALSANVHSSFLGAVPAGAEGFHKQLNIRLTQSDAATISDLIFDAAARQDVAEGNFRNQILTVELKLVQQLNAFAAQLLKHVGSVA